MTRPSTSAALAAVAGRLRCPHCGASLTHTGRALTCAGGHSYDVARQGHVALLPPRRKAASGDSAEMVAAREAFLGAGHYAPIAEAVAATAHASAAGGTEAGVCVVDLGAGTGHYLAAILEELTDAWGIALDASRPALRRALRAHPRVAAVACDVWHELPVQDGAADLIVNVFAPRNGREIARILSPDGTLVVVTPTPDHLRELVSSIGMLRVDEDKQPRLHAALAPHLRSLGSRQVEFDMTLGREAVEAVVAMGPSARHIAPADLQRRIGRLAEPLNVTGSVIVETFGHSRAG